MLRLYLDSASASAGGMEPAQVEYDASQRLSTYTLLRTADTYRLCRIRVLCLDARVRAGNPVVPRARALQTEETLYHETTASRVVLVMSRLRTR
ncbi:hypothetical protein N7481_003169 [Penicillium waksmanii]|uniref:uncharacterized protein n=1 Tax=Penicillium waksmanii TaxID=69791 RepID=UPI0025477A11|nr:uncharacterized protein N7481_003169 [Penicillium waksmanii]KAJ5987959.1 hypothetical protein N7481_003169 [Penicillium waksmanii]